MRTEYSKPALDVAPESNALIEKDADVLVRQARATASLRAGERRRECLLCTLPIENGEAFLHRNVDFVRCSRCGHILTLYMPPASNQDSVEFREIYPPLSPASYASRTNRVYVPKLEWVLGGHVELGRSREELLAAQWLELGCGAGYFLNALRAAGATHVRGIDRDATLVENAQGMLGSETVTRYDGLLSDAVAAMDADIYAAFFVLEHITDTRQLFRNLGARPTGTVFLFSVPVYGMATVLETAFDVHSARNLDGVVHTQLFTDQSIDYCLELAGYEKVCEWIFGQDALDFRRMLLIALRDRCDPALVTQLTSKLDDLVDPLQHVIDLGRFADARHVLAVKR